MEIFLVFDDGVFEGYAVRADNIGVNNKVVFGVHIAHSGIFVPNLFGIWGFVIETDDHGGDNDTDDSNYTNNSSDFSDVFRRLTFFHVYSYTFHLLL